MDKRKLYGTILGVVTFIILMIGVTRAYFLWSTNNSNKTNVNLTLVKGLESSIVYKNGTPIISTDNKQLVLSNTYKESSIFSTIEFWKKPETTFNIKGSLSLKVLNLLSAAGTTTTNIAKSDVIKWTLTSYTSSNSNENVLATGSLKGKKKDDTFTLISNVSLNNTQTFYKLYIWVDSNYLDRDTPINGETLSLEIHASATT